MIAAQRGIDVAIVHATARQELRWTEAQLAEPITRAAVRMTLYNLPAVVLGCGQRPTEDDLRRAASGGLDLLVRQSGGGAMLVGPWLIGATVAVPVSHPHAALPVSASYRWLGAACVRWLGSIGVAARSIQLAAQIDACCGWACFGRTSCWEVEAGGRKIAGFAQIRRHHGVIFTAGLLLASPPWQALCTVLGKPRDDALALARGTVVCEQVLGRPLDVESAARAWGDCLADALHMGEISVAA